MNLRAKTFAFLEFSSPKGWAKRYFDLFMVGLILSNVAAIILESVDAINSFVGIYFYYFEFISVTIFTVEYVLRVWSACDDPSGEYQRPIFGRIKYIITPLALVDLLSFLPFYLSTIFGVDLRLLRLFRLIRIIKITRYSPAISAIINTIKTQQKALVAALLLMFMALIISSTIMYYCENLIQPDKFSSIPMAMWWGMATLTTVGYGDMYPITPLGQLFGIATMVVGIGMFALPAGIIANGFSNEIERMKFTVNWKLVSKVPFFRDLDVTEIADIVTLLTPKKIPQDYVIVKQGDAADSMYFILSGQLEVRLESEKLILSEGEFFGETAIVKNIKRSATVVSKTECNLLELRSESLNYLLNTHDDLNIKMNTIINKRNN